MRDFPSRLRRGAAQFLATTALAALVVQSSSQAAFTDLISLGSESYIIDPGVSIGSYSQDTSGTTFSPSVSLGDTVGGTFGSLALDWSSFSDLNSHIYLKISFTGANPLLPMTLVIFNPDVSQIISYQGTTVPIGSALDYFRFDLVEPFIPSVVANVAGAQITWDGGASSVNATLQAIASESEPPVTAGGSFTARAPGGVRFLTSTNATGVQLVQGATDWASLSDRHAKTDVTPVDHRETLRQVDELPVTAWNYKHDPHRPYVGPMAQDFHAAFGLGHDDKHISTLDTDGVTLSALKGLIEELRERQERSAAQARRLAELEAELRTLSEKLISNLPPAP